MTRRFPSAAVAVLALALTAGCTSTATLAGPATSSTPATPSSAKSSAEAGPTYLGPTWPAPTRRPVTAPFDDRWHMEGHIPYHFKMPNGAGADVVLVGANPSAQTVTINVYSAQTTVSTCDLAYGGTCTFAGRTWRGAGVYTNNDGAADLEATTPPPAE